MGGSSPGLLHHFASFPIENYNKYLVDPLFYDMSLGLNWRFSFLSSDVYLGDVCRKQSHLRPFDFWTFETFVCNIL